MGPPARLASSHTLCPLCPDGLAALPSPQLQNPAPVTPPARVRPGLAVTAPRLPRLAPSSSPPPLPPPVWLFHPHRPAAPREGQVLLPQGTCAHHHAACIGPPRGGHLPLCTSSGSQPKCHLSKTGAPEHACKTGYRAPHTLTFLKVLLTPNMTTARTVSPHPRMPAPCSPRTCLGKSHTVGKPCYTSATPPQGRS